MDRIYRIYKILQDGQDLQDLQDFAGFTGFTGFDRIAGLARCDLPRLLATPSKGGTGSASGYTH